MSERVQHEEQCSSLHAEGLKVIKIIHQYRIVLKTADI